MQISQRTILISIAAVIGVFLLAWAAFSAQTLFAPAFSIESSAFARNGNIPSTYACDGEGKSPPLSFSNIPANTRSIVVTMFDPDAPKKGFVHWVLYNIDPKTATSFEDDHIPAGSVEGLNGTGKPGYQPICPPSGTHRYIFTAYAMSTNFHFVKAPDIDHLKKVMKWQVLARAELTGKYTKK